MDIPQEILPLPPVNSGNKEKEIVKPKKKKPVSGNKPEAAEPVKVEKPVSKKKPKKNIFQGDERIE